MAASLVINHRKLARATWYANSGPLSPEICDFHGFERGIGIHRLAVRVLASDRQLGLAENQPKESGHGEGNVPDPSLRDFELDCHTICKAGIMGVTGRRPLEYVLPGPERQS